MIIASKSTKEKMRAVCVSLFKSAGSGEGFGFLQHTERSIWCARAPCHGWGKAMRLHTSINEENAEITEETSNIKTNAGNVLLNCRTDFFLSFTCVGKHLLAQAAFACKLDWTIPARMQKQRVRTWQLTWSWSLSVCCVPQQGQPLAFPLAMCASLRST